MNVNPKSFEEAISELEAVVAALEKGELSLDDSIEVFQKGIALSKYCSQRLDAVEKKISLLVENDQGELTEKDFTGDGGVK